MVGMLNFTQESRAEKLWSPRDSPASRHQAWVQEKFPTSSRFSNVLLVAKDILTPEVFVEVSAVLTGAVHVCNLAAITTGVLIEANYKRWELVVNT